MLEVGGCIGETAFQEGVYYLAEAVAYVFEGGYEETALVFVGAGAGDGGLRDGGC